MLGLSLRVVGTPSTDIGCPRDGREWNGARSPAWRPGKGVLAAAANDGSAGMSALPGSAV